MRGIEKNGFLNTIKQSPYKTQMNIYYIRNVADTDKNFKILRMTDSEVFKHDMSYSFVNKNL